MSFDPKAPRKLKATQEWFGSIIERPLDDNNLMISLSPSGKPMESEAAEFITPSPTLQPASRIQIYNQQYWWRLLNTLQESYPLVVRLFGYTEFNNRIAIPYLQKHRPNHWSLFFLGKFLVQWTEENYHYEDRELILNAIKIDEAFNESFVAIPCFPIQMENLPIPHDPSSIMDQILYLQPHVHLFNLDYDIFEIRQEFLKQEPDHWLEHDFPALNKGRPFFFILYRNQSNLINWKEISKSEFRLLEYFKKGATIDELCEWIETQSADIQKEVQNNLPNWFQEWILYRWLTLENVIERTP